MTTASPTPIGSSHFASLSRRPSTKQMYRQPVARPQANRQSSVPVETHARTYSLNDSSDDEIPVPVMRFSAITNALLNDPMPSIEKSPPQPSRVTPEPETNGIYQFRGSANISQDRASPSGDKVHSPYPRRVVRLSNTPGSSTSRRTKPAATNAPRQHEAQPSREESPLDLSTPAPAPLRKVRIPRSSLEFGRSAGSSGQRSNRSGSEAREEEAQDAPDYPWTAARSQLVASQGSVSKYGASAIGRTRYGEDPGLQSSMRVKRVERVRGEFMRGPARRGRRRISEDEQDQLEDRADGLESGPSSHDPRSQESERPGSQGQSFGSSHEGNREMGSFNPSGFVYRSYASGSPVSSKEVINSVLRSKSPPPPTLASALETSSAQSSAAPKPVHPVFKLPARRPDLPSVHDQENEAPPTFKKNKQAPLLKLDQLEQASVRSEIANINALQDVSSPKRQPLAPRNQNTPRRPAPPPPKMSILEAVTSTAGAATASNAVKKRNTLKVNGKYFTRLDCIGRGGSSRVYRVMAENSKFFALKRVSLDDADESTVRGFKGEIDLLKKLEGVERVIRLYDYELNEEKGTLSVLMEMGELDMNKILELRIKSENAKFDPSFVRHYWKEMLECLQAIHEHDVVHSDLKPHNFVLVQGRLKLIDFGIANAIQTDETVNVHRETQIGTPSYMSPESLMDSNAKPDARGRIPSEPKLVKLGKPSDIWSLGCILYQMVYGRAPFAHIQNPMQRCQAIINFKYDIEYPSLGVGNIAVPRALMKTMRKCLNRDQFQRPTATELLDENDPFLNPVEYDENAIPFTEELLGRILHNVMAKCKDRAVSETDLLKTFPQGYFERLRKKMEAGEPL